MNSTLGSVVPLAMFLQRPTPLPKPRETPHTSNDPTVVVFRFKSEIKPYRWSKLSFPDLKIIILALFSHIANNFRELFLVDIDLLMAQAQTSDILDNEGKEKKDKRVVFFFYFNA